jgi:hypothetical protein
MHVIRLTAIPAMLLVMGLPLTGQNNTAPAATVKTVKYAGLADAILQQRGKVVLVDFWATW